MSVQAILECIKTDMGAVDELIRKSLYSDVVLVRQVAEYIIHSGGKRLRPALVLLAARSCNYQGEAHHGLAAIVEFIHTATLLHDDVVDESEMRRGKVTANSLFGNAASVLVGDFLYSRAFQMMVAIDEPKVMEVLAETTNVIAEGEVLQLLNCHDADLDETRYLQVIQYKTAKLFSASARLGAIVAHRKEFEGPLGKYGMHLGIAFQLVDDALDYSGESELTGKNIGDDLAEGKPTFPLLHAMHNGTPEEAAAIRHTIETGGLHNLPEIMAAIERTGAISRTVVEAKVHAEQARQALLELPNSVFKDSLLKLTEFAVVRQH
ncbi:MAG: polyprenyl synthetase family protein [Proteobacteria bacterium]|nr:polyprenyl synthetase family protein [Pseudomonadota bacterium]MDE3207384.1 polyprenyl synthetase family protein [Pseudomonadota bacterium]